jgi:hypothetical protein
MRLEARSDLRSVAAQAAAVHQHARAVQIRRCRDHPQTALLSAAPDVTRFAAQGGKLRGRHGALLRYQRRLARLAQGCLSSALKQPTHEVDEQTERRCEQGQHKDQARRLIAAQAVAVNPIACR